MAGLLEDLLPDLVGSASETPLAPSLSEDILSATRTGTVVDDDELLRPTGTDLNLVVPPTSTPTGAPGAGVDGDDEEEDQTSRTLPSTEEDNSPQTTFVISDLPSAITPPATLVNPVPEFSSAVSSIGGSDSPNTPGPNETLLEAPPTTLTLDPPRTTLVTSQTSPSLASTPSADAESQLSSDGSGSNGNDAGAGLMPVLPISIALGGGILLFGILFMILYKKGKWPFTARGSSRRRSIDSDDGQLEKQLQRRWDPRVSRTFKSNGATNF